MNNGSKASTRTKQILKAMYILAWVVFICVMIQAGALLLSYFVSCINPVASKNLYSGLDMYQLRQINFRYYTIAVSLMIALLCIKAFVTFLVIKVMSKVNMENPFTIRIARLLEKISYGLLGAAILALLQNAHTTWLFNKTGIIQEKWALGQCLVMAALVFIISQVFKRGVEIQSENDLTV